MAGSEISFSHRRTGAVKSLMLRSMHQNKSSNSSGPEANSNNSFTISSQPWWRGVGHDSTSRAMLRGGIGNISSPREPINGVLVAKTSKSQVNSGMDGGADATKEMLMSVASQAGFHFCAQDLFLIVNVFCCLSIGYSHLCMPNKCKTYLYANSFRL